MIKNLDFLRNERVFPTKVGNQKTKRMFLVEEKNNLDSRFCGKDRLRNKNLVKLHSV